MISGQRRTTGRRGAAAVEFALVLPVMVLIALGCVDFGRFAYDYIALKNAARAGAEYAIMTPYTSSTQGAWESAIQQKAQDEMTNQTGYDSTNLTTTTSVVIESTGLRRVTVTATYDSFTTIVSWPGLPSDNKLVAAVDMRSI